MNIKRLFTIIGGLLLLAGSSTQAQTVFVGSETAFGVPQGYIFWTSLGPTFTQVPQPFTISSTIPGTTATVSQQNGANFERRDQNAGWAGNFAPGAELLWTQGTNGPMDFVFNNSISGFGTQIQADFYGAFSGIISAFDPSNTLLGSFTFNGFSDGSSDNSAIFVGVLSNSGIGRIELGVTDASFDPQDFAINHIRLDGTGVVGPVVPEPATLTLLGTGIMGLMGFGRRKFAGYRLNA